MFQDCRYGTSALSWRVVAPVVAWSPEGMVSAHLEMLCSETWDSAAERSPSRRAPLVPAERPRHPRTETHEREP